MSAPVERCSCEEALQLRKALEVVETYFVELGAGDANLGPMNADDGAEKMLALVRTALR